MDTIRLTPTYYEAAMRTLADYWTPAFSWKYVEPRHNPTTRFLGHVRGEYETIVNGHPYRYVPGLGLMLVRDPQELPPAWRQLEKSR